jgi:preprotein translocase subunit Sec61beta
MEYLLKILDFWKSQEAKKKLLPTFVYFICTVLVTMVEHRGKTNT